MDYLLPKKDLVVDLGEIGKPILRLFSKSVFIKECTMISSRKRGHATCTTIKRWWITHNTYSRNTQCRI